MIFRGLNFENNEELGQIGHLWTDTRLLLVQLTIVIFYIVQRFFSGLTVTIIEHDAAVGLAGTAATLGNVGPGFGAIGPMGSFRFLHPSTKIIFIIDMLVGRLELTPFLAMFCPDFWSFNKNQRRTATVTKARSSVAGKIYVLN